MFAVKRFTLLHVNFSIIKYIVRHMFYKKINVLPPFHSLLTIFTCNSGKIPLICLGSGAQWIKSTKEGCSKFYSKEFYYIYLLWIYWILPMNSQNFLIWMLCRNNPVFGVYHWPRKTSREGPAKEAKFPTYFVN